MSQYYNRYNNFLKNNEIELVPNIKIPKSSSDEIFIFKKITDRLDKISDRYYNNPYCGWLIMLANPQYGGLEFNIPDNTELRIPYPFNDAILRYKIEVDKYKQLYG